MLTGKRIVLGITGGIAAYKAAELASLLIKRGAQVRVVMTENAAKFVAPLTFETLTRNRACTDSFDRQYEIEHVALMKWADLMAVAPATANCLGKFASGIADDLMTTTLMAATCPVLMAPAMNAAMYRSAAVQANLRLLTDRGVKFVGPDSGRLACGDDDIGRMSAPEAVAEAIEAILCPRRDFAGRRVLVTAGPTVERIDPVRYITNRSTGKMGYELAAAARDRGADVVLISGPTALAAPDGVELVSVESSAQLCQAVLDRGADCDAVIQAAAPADFTPETVADQKIKKHGGDMTLKLVPTRDIAYALGQMKKPGQVLVIFAAETENLVENARAKMEKKNADMVCLNDVTRQGAGFGGNTNIVTLIGRDFMTELPLLTKRETADAILDRVSEICATRG